VISPETLARYARGGSRRLLLVVAPAGYGKTTVTAEAARHLDWNTAWYTVDLLDRDPLTFAAGIVEAIARSLPGFGDTLRRRLADTSQVPLTQRELLALLLGTLELEVERPLHLVLDDYHEGADETLNEIVDYIVGAMPATMHMVVLSRYGSGLRTSRLILADQVAHIDMEDLRLTAEQAGHFFFQTAGRSLSSADVGRLVDETEGWPAGLALVARALGDGKGRERPALADPRLKGDLFTYLAEQVYSRESPAVRAFLKRSCCLEQISPLLADCVTGSSGSSRHLDHLTLNSVFTFREDGGVYRYHRLFREYLRHKVTQEDGAEAYRSTQLVAAQACEQTGDLRGAVDLYFAAGEPRAATEVLARGGERVLDRCLAETLRDWSDHLASADPSLRPWRLLLQAHVLAREARHDEALALLESAAVTATTGDERLAFYVASAVERTLFWQGEYPAAAGACHRALAVAADGRQRMHALVSLAAALTATSDWSAAERALQEAESLASAGDHEELLRLETQRIAGLAVQGRFREAATRCRHIRERVERDMPPSFAMSFLNLAALSSLYLADYPSAIGALERATDTAERFDYKFFEPLLWDARGQIELARGNLTRGLELTEQAANHPSLVSDPGCRALALSHTGTGHRRQGNLEGALTFYDAAVRLVGDTRLRQPRLTCLANREYVACLLDEHRGLSELAALRRDAERLDLPFIAAKCAVFSAIALERRGRREDALLMLTQVLPASLQDGQLHFVGQELATTPELALALLPATPDPITLEQYLQALARHPKGLNLLAPALSRGDRVALEALRVGAAFLPPADGAALLQRGLRQRNAAVRRLAAELGARAVDADGRPRIPELTPRESQILALVAEGHRNGDIAELLVLTPSTVKKYVNRIFSKLGIDDRVQAALYYRRYMDEAPS